MTNKICKPKSARLTAKANIEAGFIKTELALLNMLFSLIPIALMAHVKAMGSVALLSVLSIVLAVGVGYVRQKFMHSHESRKRGQVVSIDDAEMFQKFRYLGSRRSNVELEKRAS